jgi:hypothetical protein
MAEFAATEEQQMKPMILKASIVNECDVCIRIDMIK